MHALESAIVAGVAQGRENQMTFWVSLRMEAPLFMVYHKILPFLFYG